MNKRDGYWQNNNWSIEAANNGFVVSSGYNSYEKQLFLNWEGALTFLKTNPPTREWIEYKKDSPTSVED